MIHVLLLADTTSRAQALAEMLAEDERLEILSAADSEGDQPDVTVAVGLAPAQIARLPSPLVVISDAPALAAAFAARVHAWLPLHSSFAELSAAIYAAACDLFVLTADQHRDRLPPAEEGAGTPAFIEKLTPRELQVLRMLADGLANKEIAAQLGFSDHTAKFHVAQILAKLGASTRTEAVMLGIRRGLVPI